MINIAVSPSEMTETQFRLQCSYVRALLRAGMMPVMVPFDEAGAAIDEALSQCAGVLFTGGNDVEPSLYGEEKLPCCGEIEPRRDEGEIRLFRKALERKMPVLGICRGIQLINVASGGTLYQDLLTQRVDVFQHSRMDKPADGVHHVLIEENSFLHSTLQTGKLCVNSRHHQAVKDLGKGLKAVAFSADGVIEAVESTGDSFVLGVQWHPESMIEHSAEARTLFSAFAKVCADFAERM